MSGAPHSNETSGRRATRLAFGVTIAFLLAQLGNWPIAFILPVAVVGLLMEAVPLSFRDAWKVFGTGVFFFFFAGTISWLLSPWPAILVLVTGVMLYQMSRYLLTTDAPLLCIISALVGFTVVPIATILYPTLGMIAALAFTLNWGLGIALASIAWLVFPANRPVPDDHRNQEMDPATVRQLALVLTLILVPLMTGFLAFSWTKILVAVYAVLFALMFSSSDARGEGLKYLTANLVYASVGMFICYELFVMVPSLAFMVPVIAMALFVYANNMFKGGPTAGFWESGIFGFLIMLGGVLSKAEVDAGGTLLVRLWQMVLAAGYVVLAYMIIEWLTHLFSKQKEGVTDT
jgi:hypothetical protein